MTANSSQTTQKKVLIVASVVSFIEWFNKENLEFLKNEMNCEVHVACNFDYMDDTDVVRTTAYIEKLKSEGFVLHNIHFARSPFSTANIQAYKKLKTIIDSNRFDLIHCHTPTVSMMTRLAARKARKKGSKVMYTCHGFHFYKGAPLKNWLLFYPIEWLTSFLTDFLVTINKEDYLLAKNKMHMRCALYVPGVGVNLTKFHPNIIFGKNRENKRSELGLSKNDFMLITVGELIPRKNQQIIIKAMKLLNNPNVKLYLCGKGPLKDFLSNLTQKLNLQERVVFLGFRKDIGELINCSDAFVFPSLHEGLPVALMEALACGKASICSNIRGNNDLIKNGENGFLCKPNDVDDFSSAITQLTSNANLREHMQDACVKSVKPYDLQNALNSMWHIYKEIIV